MNSRLEGHNLDAVQFLAFLWIGDLVSSWVKDIDDLIRECARWVQTLTSVYPASVSGYRSLCLNLLHIQSLGSIDSVFASVNLSRIPDE